MPASADSPGSERTLLFGVVALQMDFVSRDGLTQGMNAWVLQKHKPLVQILQEQGALAGDARALLEPLVERHLQAHGNDPQRSLAAIGSAGSAREQLRQLADPDVQASLVHLSGPPSDPHATPDQPPAHVSGSDPHATQDYTGGTPLAGGRFRILRPHARGGLGQVSVAHDRELNREVALKEIHGTHADNLGNRTRFLLEAEVTGGLEHPGIVPGY